MGVIDRLRDATKHRGESLRYRKAACAAEAGGSSARAEELAAQANLLDAVADELMHAVPKCQVVAGEVVPPTEQRPDQKNGWAVRNTLADPDAAAIAASFERTELLSQNHIDILALGVDAARSAGGNSLEKMLAHQLALAHKTAFALTDRALAERDSVEVARLVNAAARVMSAFQQGLLALHRVRTGGTQVVTVQHVHVGDGGQAVVTGAVQTRGPAAAAGGGV
jgi:hypothetical protein